MDSPESPNELVAALAAIDKAYRAILEGAGPEREPQLLAKLAAAHVEVERYRERTSEG